MRASQPTAAPHGVKADVDQIQSWASVRRLSEIAARCTKQRARLVSILRGEPRFQASASRYSAVCVQASHVRQLPEVRASA
jgi:hypothetical protein